MPVFALVCSKCQTELQVPNSLAGCLIRCHECEGVTRAPQAQESDGRAYDVNAGQAAPHETNKEIQDFVQAAMDRAREEAERQPYRQKQQFPVDLICAILFIGGGSTIMLRIMLTIGAGGPMTTFVYGLLLPLTLYIMGGIFLKCWLSR